MSTIVILEIKANPGTGDSLQALFKEILPDTRSYNGCISLDLIRNQDDPDTFIAYEVWESKEHYETYFQWRVDTGAIAALEPMIEGPPQIRYFNMTDA